MSAIVLLMKDYRAQTIELFGNKYVLKGGFSLLSI
jgi:hypothetical protein